ncbi:MAG: glutamate--tRNA ligase [Alphaproteobacteria bacterium]|nr:glutamate--tRNA ligase [Alphaproteobacteria bacterium]NCQ66434.1 glutamate--tRNA ligase [Alphaproteobacteria bacterium]
MTIVTRFAPSPTGFLHIGGARTALFNWLLARRHGGKFLLRIEDTDRKRFTQEAVDAILESMKWLGLDWDGDVVHQFSRAARHKEMAEKLLAEGKAYHCYCSPEELEEMREKARAEKRAPGYDGRWRERDPSEAPKGVYPVVRLKTPQAGGTTIVDDVQGEVTVQNDQLDDLILLRADGTPTYMLSVVVDDHDMGVTHIMRGDDHLTNSFRQKQIYEAFGWKMPELCHIPLIHGSDGAKLSKRHGALGVEAYREMGILPEALCNYLLRLGWSHGDDEIISRQQAIEWFTVKNIGKSPARFDMDKLLNLNGHYIRNHENRSLVALIRPAVEKLLGRDLKDFEEERFVKGMDGLKERSKDLNDLARSALIYADIIPYDFDEKAKSFVEEEAKDILKAIYKTLADLTSWEDEVVEEALRKLSDSLGLKFGKIAQPLRASLTGRTVSPGIFEIMSTLGQKETLDRLNFVINL